MPWFNQIPVGRAAGPDRAPRSAATAYPRRWWISLAHGTWGAPWHYRVILMDQKPPTGLELEKLWWIHVNSIGFSRAFHQIQSNVHYWSMISLGVHMVLWSFIETFTVPLGFFRDFPLDIPPSHSTSPGWNSLAAKAATPQPGTMRASTPQAICASGARARAKAIWVKAGGTKLHWKYR